MKSIGFAPYFALALGCSCITATSPLCAGPFPVPIDARHDTLLTRAAYGDPPAAGRRHGGHRGGRASKSAEPTIPSLKGVSQEDADKQYKKKYGF